MSVLDSSFSRESRSQVSRKYGDERCPSTRASSLLQMWRELEDEHVVSCAQHGYDEMLNHRRTDLLDSNLSSAAAPQPHDSDQSGRDHEYKDPNNSIFERSGVFGEVQRERVREIFQEWMSSSQMERKCNVSGMNNNSRSECQIGRVLDGFAVNQNGGRTEHIRRGNRKLCGKQVLLDMLNKAEKQRRKELQGLMMLRAVSQFAHRNRIQSLLRGRFLRNDRIVEDKRPSTMAASELGLLRQRHTVSSLRYELISRLDHSVSGQVSINHSDSSSNNSIIGNGNDQTETNNSREVIDEFHEPSEPSNQESDNCGSIAGRIISEGNNVEDISWRESYSHAEQWQEQDLKHRARDWLPSASIGLVKRSHNPSQNSDENWQEESSIAWSEEGEHSYLLEASEVPYEQSEPTIGIHIVNGHTENVEAKTIEDMNWQEFAAQEEYEEEQAVQNEVTDWHGVNVEYNEWSNGVGGDMDVNQQEMSGYEWSQELLASEDAYMQEAPEVWQEEDSSQEAVKSWLEGPSIEPVGRFDRVYLPDDDNENGIELRELLNRRHVSSLLRSGFRQSLDHILQSYVERQRHASIDWEVHGTLSSHSGEGDLEQQSRDHGEEATIAAGISLLSLPSPPMLPVHPLWDNASHNDNWQRHDMHQHLGTEWEVINDMRTDMARLQQRMNGIQKMLETCMDMQLELQRSIRQQVSAALNRSPSSSGISVEGFPEEGSKLDYVRKGTCCVCCEANIDSLLYRCGHMCTCSKCANDLVQREDKCPMCLTPVVEVIRAYSVS